MRKHRKLILALLSLAALATIVILAARKDEPRYHGQPLSYWVTRHGQSTIYSNVLHPAVPDEEAAEAISQIGTNALPFLLARIRYEPEEHRIKQALVHLLEKAPSPLRLEPLQRWAYADRDAADAAAVALARLGPSARSAIPALATLMNTPTFKRPPILAQFALANMGKDAVPYLVAALQDPHAPNRANAAGFFCTLPCLYTNAGPAISTLVRCLRDKDPILQANAAAALGTAALDPEIVVPALIDSLRNTTNTILRRSSTRALGAFGPRARAAEPDLLAAMSDPDQGVRRFSSNSLYQIHPQALTNAPAQ